MPNNLPQGRVYRLRNLPNHVDRLAATELIASALNDTCLQSGDIHIFSLATSAGSWKRWQTKVATLMFRRRPAALNPGLNPRNSGSTEVSEWQFRVPGLPEPLLLDTHFYGLTVLNEEKPSDHGYDCIVVSGLASHPFGSWQPKGIDRSFMWIRDTLPASLPGVRFLLYGYDTSLANSQSFQTIVDLAGTLRQELEANGWVSPAARPLLFLVHSLGGVLLKQLLVLLAGGNERDIFLLRLIRGALFFGTPSVGMPVSHLLSMVGDQPNRDLVEDISDGSRFLENLETQFRGISYLEKMRFFWAYETRTSPTVVQLQDGSYVRSGPRSVMVDPRSATGGRCMTDAASTIQIDEDHSNIVKFPPGDHRIPILISKIHDICWPEGTFLGETQNRDPVDMPILDEFAPSGEDRMSGPYLSAQAQARDFVAWDYKVTLHLLKPPERDNRLNQIDVKFGHTFNWAYDDPSIGLTEWLRKGTDIFWVSGKPGSGKSTIMKFMLDDPRTVELLRNWRSASRQIIANFFFHHRGTLQQKSFDGLLRSLLSQLLEQEPRLLHAIGAMFDNMLRGKVRGSMLAAIRSNVHKFLHEYGLGLSRRKDLTELLSRDPISEFHAIFGKLFPDMDDIVALRLRLAVFGDYNRLYNATGAGERESYRAKIWRKIKWIDPDAPEKPGPNKSKSELLIDQWCNRIEPYTITRDFLTRQGVYMNAPNRRDYRGLDQYTNDYERYRLREGYLMDLEKRHKSLHRSLMDIQLLEWTQLDLEEGIRRVFDQEEFDLEVCLFFDALDEYDGRPEVIAEFLKDLTRKSPSSRTRAKVLFSSRPWPVFRDEFGTKAGFRIHEHTQEDIREFCTGFLPVGSMAQHLILPMTEEIVKRARGVFLWVKLVMRDLAMMVDTRGSAANDLPIRLRQCLDSVPDELDDYYLTIIQRLPSATRSETYILLECLSRTTRKLRLQDIPQLMASASRQSPQEVYSKSRAQVNMTIPQLDVYLKTISGGLVESIQGGMIVQFLHQTCKEWVESTTFKHAVLGNRAHITWENGHSFLVKFYLQPTNPEFSRRHLQKIFSHAQEAEKTTGVSQYAYLSQLPTQLYREATKEQLYVPIASGHSFAVLNGLWLYLQDAIAYDPDIFMSARELLFSILLGRIHDPEPMKRSIQLHRPKTWAGGRQLTTVAEVVEMSNFLLQHGFDITQDLRGLSELMTNLWCSPDRSAAQLYLDLVTTAATRSNNPQMLLRAPLPGAFGFHSFLNGWTLLHLSPPPLARRLLDLGADVNALNGENQTSLDYVLDPTSVHQSCSFGLDWLYETACLLVARKATLNKCSHDDIRKFVEHLEGAGFNIIPLTPLIILQQYRQRLRKRDGLKRRLLGLIGH